MRQTTFAPNARSDATAMNRTFQLGLGVNYLASDNKTDNQVSLLEPTKFNNTRANKFRFPFHRNWTIYQSKNNSFQLCNSIKCNSGRQGHHFRESTLHHVANKAAGGLPKKDLH